MGSGPNINNVNPDPVPGLNVSIPLTFDSSGGNNPTTTNYPFQVTLNGDDYKGYLPTTTDISNSWGLLAADQGGTEPQLDSQLWARKSQWRIQGPGGPSPSTSTDDLYMLYICKFWLYRPVLW